MQCLFIRGGCRCIAFPVPVQTLQHRKRNVIEYCLRYFTGCRRIHLDRYRQRTESFRWNRVYVLSDLSPIRSWVTKIVCDPQGNVWIATRSQGVFRYAANGEQLAHYPMREDDGNIFYLLCDKKGELWASTWARLYRFDKQKNQFTAFPLQDNPDSFYSMAMWEDAVGNLWAGTWTEGIWKINPQTGAVEQRHFAHPCHRRILVQCIIGRIG